MIIKILKALKSQTQERGNYISLIMNIKQLSSIFRGLLNKFIYFKNIQSSFYSLEQGSKIEIFNKKSKITIGKHVFIRRNTRIRIDFNGQLKIGAYTFINDNCNINCVNHISIGTGCKIASGVCINDHDHNYKKDNVDHLKRGSVIIGDNVWIGANTVILRDTIIGDNVVIAAGSIVKGNIPANTVYYLKREQNLKRYIPDNSIV